MCRHCGSRPRWRQGEWCAHCIYDVCCRHYPKLVNGRLTSCVHGGRNGVVAQALATRSRVR